MIKITPTQVILLLQEVLKAKLVPMLHSEPGMGKSDVMKRIAEHYNLKLIDIRLSQCDPSDLMGFPTINKETNTAGYVPMDMFPVIGTPIPKGYNGWLLAMDEITSAPPAIQAASYKIILDRMVGQNELHANVACIAAGNLITDNAIVFKMSTALQSRMVHYCLTSNHKEWSDWGVEYGIHHKILSFLRFRTELVHSFDPNHTDMTFPCGRTWEFLSKIFIKNNWDAIPLDELGTKLPTIAGTVGEGAAREFVEFTRIYTTLPTLASILDSPTSATIPTEPSALYAVTGLLSTNIVVENAEKCMQYISRLPVEFQIITLRGAIRKDRELSTIASVRKWQMEKAKDLI